MLALNPTGTLPILEDGDVRLFGTAAILAYLVRAHAPDSPGCLPMPQTSDASSNGWASPAAS